MSSLRPDHTIKIWPELFPAISPPPTSNTDFFDLLPDPLLLIVFNKIGDVKTLGRCCVVSRRFQTLLPQVENILVRVGCVISDNDNPAGSRPADRSRGAFFNVFRHVFSGFLKPIQAFGQLLGRKRLSLGSGLGSTLSLVVVTGEEEGGCETGQGGVTHHSPTKVLKNFKEIRFLQIELHSGELGIDDGVMLKWRADFGSTLNNCVILGASSVIYPNAKDPDDQSNRNDRVSVVNGSADDNGSIPESFYTNGGLKLRVRWAISSLMAASSRHNLLQPIIVEHKTLDSLVLTDADGQGVLCMNRDQLEELRVKQLSASSSSKLTLMPALNMRLWYAPRIELPNGVVLKEATLVAICPSELFTSKNEISDVSWVSTAFKEPFGSAAKMLVKRRTYCLEMNSL